MADTDKTGADKKMHFVLSAIVALFSWQIAIGGALGKEYGDLTDYGHWCWWDLLADGIGVVVGATIHCLLVWALDAPWWIMLL